MSISEFKLDFRSSYNRPSVVLNVDTAIKTKLLSSTKLYIDVNKTVITTISEMGLVVVIGIC